MEQLCVKSETTQKVNETIHAKITSGKYITPKIMSPGHLSGQMTQSGGWEKIIFESFQIQNARSERA